MELYDKYIYVPENGRLKVFKNEYFCVACGWIPQNTMMIVEH